MNGRVVIVAGSDSGGGAGVQADIKTVTALGGYAATAVTALTAQDTQGVHAVHALPPDFVAAQLRVVLRDIGADCIKIGMVHSAPIIDAVADVIAAEAPDVPIVADPVMIAKGGHALLGPEALNTLRARVCRVATLLTPNIPEAEALSGLEVRSVDDMVRTAEILLTLGPPAILLTGGHGEGARITDVLVHDGDLELFESERIETAHTHGTGCTLASAIATGLAQGLVLRDAVVRARAYVRVAIARAPGLGAGHGPLNHGVTCQPFNP